MTPPLLESLTLPAGFALDLLLGDPRGWPHPVRLIGWLIRRSEQVARTMGTGRREYVGGFVLLVVVTGSTGVVVWGLLALAGSVGLAARLVVETLLIYWALAIRSLAVESLRASDEPDLVRARAELALIVGRDTETLDRPEICRACVETVAENCNDAVVAPLFWFAVGGPVGLWAYKAVNTLDSMVGYRNARYRRLGWASARLDDLAGLIPARLTWLLIGVAAGLLGENARGAIRVGWRDGRNHPSPNAGWSEAAMAGALGVQLGGEATYQGVPGEKPRLGDPGRPLDPTMVRRAVRVMTLASILAGTLAWLGRFWLLTRA
jgi:adenosylcobinamide-phosphate synthase